jgi:predicted nucleic acid-binding protein
MALPWGYFDTSVLMKRYVKENGSSLARSLMRRYQFLSSALCSVEAVSALCRRKNEKELTEKNFEVIASRMNKDRGLWELVELSPLVLTRAEELVQSTGVRTLDAIHLASALTFQAAIGMRIPFITGDETQRHAGEQLHLEVIWVG